MEKKIKALVMDVDGTMTDGSIWISPYGEVMKQFYVRDGQAIKHILPEKDVMPIVITGRESEIVSRRCEELNISILVQNSRDKKEDLQKILNKLALSSKEVAYIGDDVNDMEAMSICGLTGCPSDADEAIRKSVDFISSFPGGRGAVREFVEYIIHKTMQK